VTLQIEPEIGVPSGTRSALMGEQLRAVRTMLTDTQT